MRITLFYRHLKFNIKEMAHQSIYKRNVFFHLQTQYFLSLTNANKFFVTQCRKISVFFGYFSEKIKNDTEEREKNKKFFAEKKLTREILFKDFVS